jgi:alpha-tubulin suppressor-like RCC1 family protein
LGVADDRGDEPGEMGVNLPYVDLGTGRTATRVVAGSWRTCALLDDATVKCWGYNIEGQLGLGDLEYHGIAPGQMGDALPVVNLGTGRAVADVSSGPAHMCARFTDGALKCWGDNFSGELGLNDAERRGGAPTDMGDALPVVNLGTGRRAVAISCGGSHTCAVLDDGSVKCWGRGFFGQLGLGDNYNRGDGTNHLGNPADEMGDNLPAIDLGAL